MKRDESGAAVPLIFRRGDIDVAVVPNRQVANGAEALRHDGGVKTPRENQPEGSAARLSANAEATMTPVNSVFLRSFCSH